MELFIFCMLSAGVTASLAMFLIVDLQYKNSKLNRQNKRLNKEVLRFRRILQRLRKGGVNG
jgi:hypothetical protein